MGQPCKWCGAPLTFRRSGERWIALEDGDLGLPARELDQVTGLTAENLKTPYRHSFEIRHRYLDRGL